MTPHVTVVLLNWKNSDDTMACLTQLEHVQYEQITTVVVDNNSEDGSAERIAHAFPAAIIIRSTYNRGFAGGVNLGIQYALAQQSNYVLLLNSDISFATNLLTELVTEAEQNPAIGLLSPIVYTNRKLRRLWMYGFQVRRSGMRVIGQEQTEQQYPEDLDAITGCAMLIPAKTIRVVGLFDERFFFYCEDIDYGLRVRTAQLAVQIAPSAWVEHAPHGATQKRSGTRQFFLARSRMLLMRKYWSRFNPMLVILSEMNEALRIGLISARHADLRAIAGYTYGLCCGLIHKSR